MAKRSTLHDRFWSKVLVGGPGCWEWQAGLDSNGYGSFYAGPGLIPGGPHMTPASRAAFALMRHAPTKHVLHKCDNPRCVRPSHLFEGTQADNNRDRSAKGRSARQRGGTNGRAILTAEDVRAIRLRGTESSAVVCLDYGVSRYTVNDIRAQRSWRHLK